MNKCKKAKRNPKTPVTRLQLHKQEIPEKQCYLTPKAEPSKPKSSKPSHTNNDVHCHEMERKAENMANISNGRMGGGQRLTKDR